ncbi:MAG: hypothetical protein Q9201_006963 [Fulgogasparrea decipioides]
MSHGQPYQQPNFDYSQVRPAYSPHNNLFPIAQLGQPVNASSWPESLDEIQQGTPQGMASASRAASGTEHAKHRRTRMRAKAAIPEVSDSEEEIYVKKERPAADSVHRGLGNSSKSKTARKNTRNKDAASAKHPAQGYTQPLPSIEQSEQDVRFGQSPPTDASSPSQPGSRGSRHIDHLTPESSLSPETISLSHLPHDQRHYLEYLRTNVTYHHYFFGNDASYFVRHILIEHALSYEPLLYAVVGFAAYHATLKRPNGKIQDFLGYYDRSVSLLLKSLASNQRHTDATILTILQLATFEEYLGDWVNLLGHQKAACSMLVELYSIDSILENELRRRILAWYSRFDLFAGFLSGYETVLGRQWFAANECFHIDQAMQHPESIHCRLQAAIASHRVIALDMILLFAKLPRGAISLQEFQKENELLAARIRGWKEGLEPLLSDDRYLIKSFVGAPERDEKDIVDPYRPGCLMQGPLWTMNFLMMDWLGTSIMHTSQTARIMQKQPPPRLKDLALDVCRLFEAVEYWPGSVPGSILSAQAGLGIAVMFLPQDERHTMWCRRKLAKIEAQGYTYPPNFRDKLANLWGIAEVHHWWLPDEEACPSIVRSIRSFIEARTPSLSRQPKAEDVRTMKGLVDKLNID